MTTHNNGTHLLLPVTVCFEEDEVCWLGGAQLLSNVDMDFEFNLLSLA